MDKQTYEQRRQARIDRLRARAARLSKEAEANGNQARQMASMIPFGQPILVGHYSEKRDRNYRSKITRKFEKSFELSDEAQNVERRADAAESNRAISSDDPEAVVRLKEKLQTIEATRAKFREINRLLRADDIAGLKALGYSDAGIAELKTPDFAGRVGIPDYRFSNLSGQVQSIKKRIAALGVRPAEDSEKMVGDVRVVENTFENRIQLYFPGKPEAVMISALKSRGFRWSPSQGCWQRQLTGSARWAVEDILKVKGGSDGQPNS